MEAEEYSDAVSEFSYLVYYIRTLSLTTCFNTKQPLWTCIYAKYLDRYARAISVAPDQTAPQSLYMEQHSYR